MIIDYTTIYRTRVGDRSADVVIDGARVCDGAGVGDCTTWRVGDVIVVGDGSRVDDGTSRFDGAVIGDGDGGTQIVGEGARVDNGAGVVDGDSGTNFVRDCAGVAEEVVGVNGAIVDDLTVVGEDARINQCNTRTNCYCSRINCQR